MVAFCYHTGMSQPVKLSDQLVLDARLAGKATERSIAGQVEFWAKLGRAIEPLLHGDRAIALCRSGAARRNHSASQKPPPSETRANSGSRAAWRAASAPAKATRANSHTAATAAQA